MYYLNGASKVSYLPYSCHRTRASKITTFINTIWQVFEESSCLPPLSAKNKQNERRGGLLKDASFNARLHLSHLRCSCPRYGMSQSKIASTSASDRIIKGSGNKLVTLGEISRRISYLGDCLENDSEEVANFGRTRLHF